MSHLGLGLPGLVRSLEAKAQMGHQLDSRLSKADCLPLLSLSIKLVCVLATQRALRAGSAGLATSGHPGCTTCQIRIGRACYIETIRAALAPEARRAG
jgi:hypothetical protein